MPRSKLIVPVFLVLMSPPLASAQSSASYRLERWTVGSAGGVSSGDLDPTSTVAISATLSQPSPVETSSSLQYVVQSGFWSTGTGPVEILLFGTKNASTLDPKLDWSGNEQAYELQRSDDCTAVAGSFLASTPAKTWIDHAVPPADLFCYSVIPLWPPPGGSEPAAAASTSLRRDDVPLTR